MMCLTLECGVLLCAVGLFTLTHQTPRELFENAFGPHCQPPVAPGVEHRYLLKVMWTSTTQELMHLVPSVMDILKV